MSESVVRVAAAAVFDGEGRVLISRRADDTHQGGMWEFPGGKLEAGEDARRALQRELDEEVGIHITAARPLIRVRHDYPDKSVLLDVWRVDSFEGEAHGREGQPLRWVSPVALDDVEFPAANLPIVRAVQLPDVYLITPDLGGMSPADFLHHLELRLRGGIRLVQLRAKSLGESEYLQLARETAALCHRHGARLLLNADAVQVAAAGADGVHLSSGALRKCKARPLAAGAGLVAASCHDADELARAAAIGADFALLSPVAATTSHPDIEPLGWERFEELVEPAPFPVYALGGMTPDDREAAWLQSGQGIAAIRALWEA
ncbi:MAG: Nudix family hydrolase [Gammaproteobacteria bacterium]|nr:Nudix family hydrolase [Gammaproteobacteria bacterium]